LRVFLVRHASAGRRTTWQGDDRLRPLDERGARQAKLLVEQLSNASFELIVSSTYLRCAETVVPLAKARDLSVQTDEALAEGAGADAALALFRGLAADLVASVHGDLVEELLGEKRPKGSTTLLEFGERGDPVELDFLEPAA